MIREYKTGDLEALRAIHAANGLPENCFPNLTVKVGEEEIENPLFIAKAVLETDGKPAMASFLKGTAEVYVLVDHAQGTPEERWQWMRELTSHMKREAWKKGLEQFTCWVPAEIEESFAKRLDDLGFVKSPWNSYTLAVEP